MVSTALGSISGLEGRNTARLGCGGRMFQALHSKAVNTSRHADLNSSSLITPNPEGEFLSALL